MDTQMTHLNTGPVPGLDSFAFFNKHCWENQKNLKAVSGWRGLPFLCKFENISKQETKCMKKEKVWWKCVATCAPLQLWEFWYPSSCYKNKTKVKFKENILSQMLEMILPGASCFSVCLACRHADCSCSRPPCCRVNRLGAARECFPPEQGRWVWCSS